MTKSIKKETIALLLDAAEETKDICVAEEKLTKAIGEIYLSGYNFQKLKIVSKALDLFIKDIPAKFVTDLKSKSYVSMSKNALLTLIDFSNLPD
jgi:hypothetical protein